MTVSVADEHAHVQRLVLVVKMVTVLEGCTTKGQHSIVHFLWAKGLSAKDIHKEIFPIYGRKSLSCKTVRNWVEKHGRLFVDDEEVEMGVWKWLSQ
jgi:hypothetical protein